MDDSTRFLRHLGGGIAGFVARPLLVNRIPFLRTYNIPKPVAGGLLIALIQLVIFCVTGQSVQFDPALQTPLMLAFFATIGLNADFASLRRGGRAVFIFLLVVTGLLLMQNTLGSPWLRCFRARSAHGVTGRVDYPFGWSWHRSRLERDFR